MTRPRRRIQDKDVPVIDYLKINNTMTIKDLRNPVIQDGYRRCSKNQRPVNACKESEATS